MASEANIGIMIPVSYMGAVPNPRKIADFCQAVETLGFHSLWAMERLFHNEASVLHPFTTLAWAAAVTSRVKLGTAVVLATLRHPLLLAKTAATLHYLSEGRFTFGISLGGRPEDFQALNIPIPHRPQRLEETIALMRQVWENPEVSFHGRHFNVEGLVSGPRPTRPDDIPILLGGHVEPVLRRAATLADGWLPGAIGTWTPQQFREGWQSVLQYARKAGRQPAELANAMLIYFSVDDTAEKARQPLDAYIPRYYGGRFDADKCVYGSPAQCAEKLQAFFDAGVQTVILHLLEPSVRDLERVRREVIPLLQ